MSLSSKKRAWLERMLARAIEVRDATREQREQAIANGHGLEVLVCNSFLAHINELIAVVADALTDDTITATKHALALVRSWRDAYPQHTVDIRK
mgnify:CR=1 FL=1